MTASTLTTAESPLTAASTSRRTSKSTPKRPRALRVLGAALAIAAGVTGVVGLLHLPVAAPLLRKIAPASMCPVRRGTPEQVDRGHAVAARAIRASATTTAPRRPALGFELDKSTKSDVLRWAAVHRVACSSIGGNESLQKCANVPAVAVGQRASFGPLEEVSFEFRSSGELRDVETTRRHLSPEAAAETVAALARDAVGILGDPTEVGGEPTAAHLARGTMSTYVAEHVFTDYRATVSATNLAHTGVMVREQYFSATD